MEGVCQGQVYRALPRLPEANGIKKVLLKILSVVLTVFAVLLGALAILICRSVSWALKTWSDLSIEEIVYHLKMPLEGTNSDMIMDYVKYCVILSICVAVGLAVAFILVRRRKRIYHITRVTTVGTAVLIGFLAVQYFGNTLDIAAYVENQNTYSSFIDDNYVNPADVTLTFPEKKRNLIYIFLESMENTYADTENGGAFDENVIPELTELSKENENFSGDQDVLNGGYALTGATWTIGAMFAQTSGLPLTIPLDKNSMGTQEGFFPGMTALGDVLEQAGYQQTLLIGSDAAFGGRKLYFKQHGDYEIADYNYAVEHGDIPSDYYVWWGYEDKILFENAKNKLNLLAASDEPFNLTMLTVDTHFEDGYLCSECPDLYSDNQYSNVMACSSKQVTEFIEWIKEQPFYENTTIVISGDHPTMDSDYCEAVDAEYRRTVYTTYINSATEVQDDVYREYSTFDNFPTTLASLGVEIPDNRLGLGVNLFSDEKTIIEEYGLEAVNQGLSQKSALMEGLIAGLNQTLVNIDIMPYNIETKEIEITLSDIHCGEGMTGLLCGVWSDKEQKDMVWYDAQKQSDGVYTVAVPFSDFSYKNGTYNVHIYARMIGNTNVFLGSQTVKMEDTIYEEQKNVSNNAAIVVDIEVEPYDYHTGKFDVYIRNLVSEYEPMALQCAVWSEDGQEDLCWYEGEREAEGSYVIHVYARDFQYKEDQYNVHVYGIDDEGSQVLLGTTVGVID
ncbi:GBS Bsp-like repeat-containing protein [Wansuia hejianensis]|uniref:GBS Bsp-like repeat-containing protein n=1 Tax=Wansuia hejianensis TaxID=2763667 RepID=A0A7G9GHE5_9FIRM|nr:GBS Bsp-like repeat-containing protein [Wansuia hejianensis]QNM10227.1 GBS Bsp-like repeat-containing protein [Wansuia hejianensis]RHV88517.1 phosphoglycerol transferase [Lachnospiraceae bacterium OF09-33XD]